MKDLVKSAVDVGVVELDDSTLLKLAASAHDKEIHAVDASGVFVCCRFYTPGISISIRDALISDRPWCRRFSLGRRGLPENESNRVSALCLARTFLKEVARYPEGHVSLSQVGVLKLLPLWFSGTEKTSVQRTCTAAEQFLAENSGLVLRHQRQIVNDYINYYPVLAPHEADAFFALAQNLFGISKHKATDVQSLRYDQVWVVVQNSLDQRHLAGLADGGFTTFNQAGMPVFVGKIPLGAALFVASMKNQESLLVVDDSFTPAEISTLVRNKQPTVVAAAEFLKALRASYV